MPTAIQKGKQPLRPRARIIRTIGEELISNDSVAILELVKNSYDADSKKVEITFSGPLTEGQGSIVIKDYGSGMDLDTVKKGWMEPATIVKRISKKSAKGRKVLGEKGIGRFASAKLSRKLEMITRVRNDNEIIAQFNWEEFGNEKKYLDEINCSWEVRAPQTIEKQGTILILKDLNSGWDKEKLRGLKISLSRLINPFDPIKDFAIELILPREFDDLSGLVTSPKTLEKPDYKISGKVDPAGNVVMEYFSKKAQQTESIKYPVNFKPTRKPICGPIEFEIRVWDRDLLKNLSAELGEALKDIKRDLDETAGISIYRDGFRVLPYGEPKNDWLRLDLRRVQNPTMRLSNNQIKGYVSISLDKNPVLKDQSNREGIVESSAFNDFKDIIISVLREMEDRRYKERPREEKETDFAGLFSKISVAPVMEMVEKKLPGDIEAKQIVIQTDNAIKEGIQKVQEVLSRYRRLSTLGLLLDVVLHDGNGILLRLDNEVCLLEKEFKKDTVSNEKMNQHIELIKNERKVMTELFKRLEPFSGRKRGKPKDIILEDAIRNVFALFNSKLEKLKVVVKVPESKTMIKFDESDFEIVFVNLLENTLYWMDRPGENKNKIVIAIDNKDDELSIIFSDNGPGVKEEDVPFIFDPYFTKKAEGIGLGLTIIGELVSEYNGSFELISNGPLDGATFRITFRKRI